MKVAGQLYGRVTRRRRLHDYDRREIGSTPQGDLLHPRKKQNTECGPEAGVRGASPGVWVRRTGGGMFAYTEGVYPHTEGGLSPIAILSVSLPVCVSSHILNFTFYINGI